VTEAGSQAAGDRPGHFALVGREGFRESWVLTRVYERCREAFVGAQTTFAYVQASMATGRFSVADHDELVRQVGDFEQWAQLALRIADREVEAYVQRV
jgi:hypothetical protein